MALIPKAAYVEATDAHSINIYDITGLYDPILRPSSYGNPSYTPHPLPVDITAAEVWFYPPDPSSLLPSTELFVPGATTALGVDVFPQLPTLISTTPFIATDVMFYGTDQKFIDGIGRFIYLVRDGGDNNYWSDVKVPMIANVFCCIQNLILAADLCGCKGTNHRKLLEAKMFLDQLVACSRELGNISPVELCLLWNKGAEIIMAAQAICDSQCEPCAPCG